MAPLGYLEVWTAPGEPPADGIALAMSVAEIGDIAVPDLTRRIDRLGGDA